RWISQSKATIRLDIFPDETRVREILKSHGFTLRDLSVDQVRVRGSFLELKAAKAALEALLLHSQTKADVTSSSSSPVPNVSSGAISKYYKSSDGSRSRSGSRNKPPPSSPTASPSRVSGSSNNHATSPEFSPRSDQRSSLTGVLCR
ncbi:hypothetical protein GBF38_010771, partial [Nibea albiflora]